MTNMMRYPFMSALGNTIYHMVLNDVAPIFNESIASMFSDMEDLPSFGDSNVVYGNQTSISEPTICVYIPQSMSATFSNGVYRNDYKPVVSLRLPHVTSSHGNGNQAEMYARMGDLFVDAMTNVFMAASNVNMIAKNSAGQQILPKGHAVIQRVLLSGALGFQLVRDANQTLLYQKWDCFLNPLVLVNLRRENT